MIKDLITLMKAVVLTPYYLYLRLSMNKYDASMMTWNKLFN